MNQALGIKPVPTENRKPGFLDLFGRWSGKNRREFKASINDLSRVNPEGWK